MNRIESPARSQQSSSIFEKVLRAFETGDFAYTEVLSQLKRVLAGGASPQELVEILRRRETVAPLPKYAYMEVLALLNEAMARDGAASDPASGPAELPTAGPSPGPAATTIVPPPRRADGAAKSGAAPSVSVFEKVLGAFDTGGFTFDDVLTQVTRLLGSGASPTALLEVLQRREAIEPLPDYAHDELVGLLDDAIRAAAQQSAESAQIPAPPASLPAARIATASPAPVRAASGGAAAGGAAAANQARTVSSLTAHVRALEDQVARQNADYEALSRSHERIRDAGLAAEERAVALAADLASVRAVLQSERVRARETAKGLSERMASAEAARSRGEDAVQESERIQSEARTLRELLAARDAALTQVRRSLGERDAQLAALQQEHAAVVPTLEARADAGVQLNAQTQKDLQAARAQCAALTAELAAARAAVESEERKSRDYESETRTLRQSVGVLESSLAGLRRSLEDRDAQFAELRQEHAAIVPALEARADAGAQKNAQLQKDLQAAQAQSAALNADLAAAHTALESKERRALEIDRALTERIASAEAARMQTQRALQDALGESQGYEAEARTLRQSLAGLEGSVTELRRSLEERDAELGALRAEQAAMAPLLDARAKTTAQLGADLQTLRAHAEAATSQLEAARSELKDNRDMAAAAGAELRRKEELLKSAQAELSALKTQSVTYLEALRTREWRRGYEEGMLRDSDAAVEPKAAVDAGGAPAATQNERGRLQAQVADLQKQLDAHDASLEKAREAASLDAEHLGELQAAAQRRDSEHAANLAQSRAAHVAEIEQLRSRAPARSGPRKPVLNIRVLGLGAALLTLVAVVWGLVRHREAPAQTPVRAAAPLPAPGSVIRDCPTCPTMVILPTGRFIQGADPADRAAAAFEKPPHAVLIRHPLAMSANAVTVDEFQQYVAETGADVQGCDTYDGEWRYRDKNSWKDPGFVQTGIHPVTCTSWIDAQAFARWLSAKTGHHYRLPSASEWEYAARTGGAAAPPWSADGSAACANANVADQSAAHRYPGWTAFACDDGYVNTAPVGSFKANSFGLHDMLGNVFQWTEDCWHRDYTGAPIDGSARTDGDCSEHELRGGSWFSAPAYVRANYRNHFAADYRTSSVGIRLVRDLEQ